jgi:DNA-binding NarL/FixJ family response regulator
MNKIRIALVEDHDLTRIALRTALQCQTELEWIGEAATGKEGLTLLQSHPIDVGIVDIGLPEIDGIELTKRIKMSQNAPKILILTLNDDENAVLGAFAAGADSYCIKTTRPNLLLEAIKVTYEGNTWIDSAIAKIVLAQAQPKLQNSPSEPVCELTDREIDVLQLIVDGHSNNEIAVELHITVGTVKTHVRNILNKLSASDRTQAAVMAIRSGLII